MEDQSGIITELTAELDNLKVQLENVKTSKAELDKTARQLKDSLELLQQSSSARANHIAFLCENLDKTREAFSELFSRMISVMWYN